MVQSLIKTDEHEDRILNIVKAKHGLKNKSEAVAFVINNYEDNFLEPELLPEYIEKAKRLMKQKPIPVGTVANLRKRYE